MPDGTVIDPLDFPPASTIRPNPDYVPAYIVQPAAWLYDIDQANGLSRTTYIGEVFIGGQAAGNQAATKADIAAATTGVSTFNTRSGAVTLLLADVTGAGGAPANSPTFAGVPNAPTAAPGTNTTQLATCMFVTAAIGQVTAATVASFNGRTGVVTLSASDVTTAGGALTASPAFTGTPTTPTANAGNASSQIASTQFVSNAIAGAVVSWNGRTGGVVMTLSDVTSVGGAPISSPAFTGTPTVPTAAPGTATTQAASTAFVTNAITGATTGVSSFNTRTGAVTLTASDVTGVNGALNASPAFTGTPTAPTATAGTNTTQLATTAFVATAISSMAPVVASWNGRSGAVTLTLADVTSVGAAPLASPTFTGIVAAPTPTQGDNSTKLATTAFVTAAIGALAPIPGPSSTTPGMDAGAGAIGAATTYARADHTHPTDTTRAAASALANYLPLAGGNMTGSVTNTGNFTAPYYYSPTGGLILGAAGNTAAPLFWNNGGNAYISQVSAANLAFIYLQANTTMTNSINSYNVYPRADNAYNCGAGGGLGWAVCAAYAFNQQSSADVKRDIAPMPACLGFVQAIEPKRYRWNNAADEDPFKDDIHWGFIAQDVEAAFADTPFGGHRVEANGGQSLAYNELTAVLWQAVREMAAGNATLRERVEALEARASDAALGNRPPPGPSREA